MAYNIKIKDNNGNSFTVSVSIEWMGKAVGTWRTIDKGWICHDSGDATWGKSTGTLTSKHLYFHGPTGKYGLRLNDFMDFWGYNEEGEGHLSQPWVLGAAYGRISWALV